MKFIIANSTRDLIAEDTGAPVVLSEIKDRSDQKGWVVDVESVENLIELAGLFPQGIVIKGKR